MYFCVSGGRKSYASGLVMCFFTEVAQTIYSINSVKRSDIFENICLSDVDGY